MNYEVVSKEFGEDGEDEERGDEEERSTSRDECE